MARIDLTMPKMGESVAEATLVKWCKNIGDRVEMDETILEIATDKVDSEVPSPKSGILIEKLFPEEAVVQVGAVFGILETESPQVNPVLDIKDLDKTSNGHSSENPYLDKNSPERGELAKEPIGEPIEILSEDILGSIPGLNILLSDSSDRKQETVKSKENYNSEANISSSPSGVPSPEDRFYSPLVREIAKKEGLNRQDLDQIKGSGLEGRVTKNDILDFILKRKNPSPISEVLSNPYPDPSLVQNINPRKESLENSERYLHEMIKENPKPDSISGEGEIPIQKSEGDEIIVMDRMRRLISEHMIMSKNVSAHVTSFVEADVTAMVLWRERIKKEFQAREKENITYTPIFIEAVAKVLKSLPMVNVSVQGNSIIVHKHIHIGMATALPNGNLIVPVVKDADLMSLVGITKKVNDLAARARAGKLNPDETSGGTFTITNVGTFGNLMGTPIINQPQVAILATGAIVKKPSVLETEYGDVIAIRHKIFLSLSYDHRVVDGALGGTFLRKVADELESFDPNRSI
jgi:2-oxoglutarate dehydrogenase E2 component (dihydrolipoamide succinyltransferase)